MGWSAILEEQKDYSFEAYKVFGKDLFKSIFERLDKLEKTIITRVNEKRPKEDMTEAEFLKRAMKLADVDYQLKTIGEMYYKGLLMARLAYYKATRRLLMDGFNDSTPSFIRLSGGPSKAELGMVTTYIFGQPVGQLIKRRALKLSWRLDDIVASSIRPVSTNVMDYKTQFRDAVKGAFNAYKKSYENLMRDLFAEIFEQLQNSFFGRLNG